MSVVRRLNLLEWRTAYALSLAAEETSQHATARWVEAVRKKDGENQGGNPDSFKEAEAAAARAHRFSKEATQEFLETETLVSSNEPNRATVDDLISLAELAVELDSTPYSQVDADVAFAALIQLGAVARKILGLKADGSQDPGARNPDYKGTRLRLALRRVNEATRKRQLGS